ncbi:RNase adapter RapZ [Thermodesulfovibrio hydrogeniphilus]
MKEKPKIVIVTGLSGAGKTVTLRTLEDMGFFCIDNLPPPAVPEFLEILNKHGDFEKIAIAVDIRAYKFLKTAVTIIEKIKEDYITEVLFLEADDETILRRYKETRRPHPLYSLYENLQDAIKEERKSLSSIRSFSDRIVDTSNFNPHELKFYISSIFGGQIKQPTITIISFGFKKGIPSNADLVFDARFLPNPYFIPSLSPLTGKEEPVKDFVLKQKETKEFLDHVFGFLKFALEGYKREGRAYITIAIGCTGGKHRSVVLAEEIANFIKGLSLNPILIHRDL